MTTGFIIQMIVYFIATMLVIYGLFHEKQLIAFEQQLVRFIVYKIRRGKTRKTPVVPRRPDPSRPISAHGCEDISRVA